MFKCPTELGKQAQEKQVAEASDSIVEVPETNRS